MNHFTGWLISGIAATAFLLPMAVAADDDVKIQKVQKRYLLMCERAEQMGGLLVANADPDPGVFLEHFTALSNDPSCELLKKGDTVFVHLPGGWEPYVDAFVTGTLPSAYDGAPPNADIIRVRLGGESVWRYSLMRFLI
ncbi:hypothetical protein VW29_19345 [Devosia limi DSM 17137]|uniref:Integron gene cassette protein n=1 Tax=Devosia limi DSM 17137 TaxID=1121477 RepID=A0A0F5L359_9HYPH|nr:hypothetical protein [Devosia limi]KKB76803.1 hypothetical protein VW29_19345 [Devosia limi DSM 17137]SHF29140.1 hypothetical protein SAMN02745223_02234 [Devosia limi DSM 17137]